MGSGTGPRGRTKGRVATSATVLAAALAAPLLAGGCATLDPALVLAEREAAMARWSSCVARHAGRGDTSIEAIEATRAGCDGYRRDVALTFAPYLGTRVQASLGARERERVVRERQARAAVEAEPVSSRDWRERVERLLIRATGGRGDG